MMENQTKNQEQNGTGFNKQPYQTPHYAPQNPYPQQKKLYRSTTNKWIAGVCGGLGEHFNTSPTLIRVLWILLTIFSVGAGIIGYVLLWALVEKYPAYYMASGPYVTQDEHGRTHYHYYYRSTR